MNDILKFWIPVVISIIAIVFAGIQQFISNKQFLFDKRLYFYRLYKMLLKHQKDVEIYFGDESAESICVDDMLISELTNDSILQSSIIGWTNRNGDTLMKAEDHKIFLSMIEELRGYGVESSFVFSGEYGRNLYEYFNKYADLCFKTYQYSIFMENIKNENKQPYSRHQAMPLDLVIDKQRPLHIELNQIYTDLCELSESIKLSDLEKSISFIRRTNHENNTNSGYSS